jgi:hypothetical protein
MTWNTAWPRPGGLRWLQSVLQLPIVCFISLHDTSLYGPPLIRAVQFFDEFRLESILFINWGETMIGPVASWRPLAWILHLGKWFLTPLNVRCCWMERSISMRFWKVSEVWYFHWVGMSWLTLHSSWSIWWPYMYSTLPAFLISANCWSLSPQCWQWQFCRRRRTCRWWDTKPIVCYRR